MTTEKTFAQRLHIHAKEHLERLFDKGVKEIMPLALLHLRGKLVAMPFKADSAEEEKMRKDLVIMMLRASRALGEFEAMAMISEAWISCNTEYAKNGKRPQNDPDRVDAAVISIRSDEEFFFQAFRVEETPQKKKLGSEIQFLDMTRNPGAKTETWFDPGFENGPPLSFEQLRRMRKAYNDLLPAFTLFNGGLYEKN